MGNRRVPAAAERIAATRERRSGSRLGVDNGATPYQQAQAIESYLRDFPFSLAVSLPPPGRDIVDYLLFDLKQGYFDYQSTAMAVMLRSVGIPARVAVGYVLDPDKAQDGKYTVSQGRRLQLGRGLSSRSTAG